MKYEEQLLMFINDDDDDAMMNWILRQSSLDQVDILRELRQLVEELAYDDREEETAAILARLDQSIEEFEDRVLDEKLAHALLQMAIEEDETILEQIEQANRDVGAYVIECIVNNKPNAKKMRQFAEGMMEMEKEYGTFNPENWKEIL